MVSYFRGIAVLFFCLACMAVPCHAEKMAPTLNGTLDKAQIALGKVHPGDSAERVRELCGEPLRSARTAHGEEVYSYGNGSFVITFSSGKVQNMFCMKDGEMETPDGVKLWQDEVVLDEVYGMASQIEEREDGCTIYAYWGNISAPYQYLAFTMKNGSIVRIACGVVQ